MNSIIETLNQWGGRFADFAWPMLWQSSLLIIILFAVEFLLRRRIRASIRYAFWLVVLVKLCLPPTLALPTSPIWWLPETQPPAAPPVHYTVTYGALPLPEVSQNPAPVYVAPEPVMTSAAWLLLTSGFVSVLLLGLLLARWWHIAKLVRSSRFSERLTAMLNETRQLAGVKSASPVRLAQNTTSPAICGLFRPAILIPQSLAEKFSDEQLRAVLLHELVHLRRRDVWLNCFQALLQIAYWWHPLLWLANARIRHVREEAVDDAVMLALQDKSETYAPTLLEVAKLALNRPLASLGLVGILESRSALRQRIERLVNFQAPRNAGLTLISLLGIAVFTAIVVPMGSAPDSGSNSDKPGGQKKIASATNTTSVLQQTETNNLAELTELAILDLKRHFESTNEQTRAGALMKFAFAPVTVTEAKNPALDDALPVLIQATKDNDRMIRLWAVDALWRIKSTNQLAVKALGNVVDVETDLDTAALAASTLKEIGPAAVPAVPELVRALEQRNDDGTIAVGAGSKIEPNFPVGTALRRAIIEALGNIGPAAQSAIPILRKLLTDTGRFSLGNRVFSAKALWQITGKTNEALPILISALKNDDSFWAADVLGMMGRDAKPATPVLQNALHSRSGYTRLRSAVALSKIDPGFQVPMPLLLELLNDPNSATRFGSAQMIWTKTHDSQTILPTLLDLIKPDKRQPFGMDYRDEKVISLLGEIGPPAKAAVPRLREIIQDSRYPHVRDLAAEALKRIQPNTDPSSTTPDQPDKSAHFQQQSQTIMKPGPVDAASRVGSLVADGKLLYEMGKFDKAERSLRSALALEPENRAAKYYLGLVQAIRRPPKIIQTGPGRKEIVAKLDQIHLDRFGPFDGATLGQVVRNLGEAISQEGIRLTIASGSYSSVAVTVDPATGMPVKQTEPATADTKPVTVHLFPDMENVSLLNALKAIISGASRPIKFSVQGNGIIFSEGASDAALLFSRTFKVNTNVFLANLQRRAGSETNVVVALRRLFSKAGVKLTPSKAIFYNDRLGLLFVRATEQDLDAVERIVVQLNDNKLAPQIHIKARFIELPERFAADVYLEGFNANNHLAPDDLPQPNRNTLNQPKFMTTATEPTSFTGIMTESQFQAALHSLERDSGLTELAAPEGTTLSGREMQMRATTMITVVTNFGFHETSTHRAIFPQTNVVETGPVLDTIATISPNGYGIDLKATASLTDFLGYDNTTNTTVVYDKAGEKINLPTISPSFDIRRASAHVKLWDGQTLVLGLQNHFYNAGKEVGAEPDYFVKTEKTRGQPSEADKTVVAFITATLVDPAGNRIHSENQMPFVKDSIPAQDGP